MNKQLSFLTILGLSMLLVGAGCSTTESTEETAVDTVTDSVEEQVVEVGPGEVPFDYPTVATTAVAGDYVLAPSRTFVDDAFAETTSTFVFYSRTMVEPGAVESTIDEIFEEVTMPNSLIIPLPSGATAAEGDVLLTWWQSGSGMQRAFVVDASTPTEPVVRYIDIDLDNPATNIDGVPYAEAEEALEADSFTVLSEEFAPGSAVAVLEDGEYEHYQVINDNGSQLLLTGFAGRMAVADKADAVALPIIPTVAEGDSVKFPLFGSMSEGTVTRVDSAVGRVYVEYEFGGGTEEDGIPFGDVISADAL